MATPVHLEASSCYTNNPPPDPSSGTLLKHLSAPVGAFLRSPLLFDASHALDTPVVSNQAPTPQPQPLQAPPRTTQRFASLPTTIKHVLVATIARVRSLRKPRPPPTDPTPPHDQLLALLQHQLPPGATTSSGRQPLTPAQPWSVCVAAPPPTPTPNMPSHPPSMWSTPSASLCPACCSRYVGTAQQPLPTTAQELGRPSPRLRSVAAALTANPPPKGTAPPLPLLLNPVMPPSHVAVPGALLVADVSGFTQLTERLSTRGPAGVELLTRCLNSYFDKVHEHDVLSQTTRWTQVISTCEAYEGDVCRFAGDSLIVAFWAEDTTLPEATLRATCCAWDLGQHLGRARDGCNMRHQQRRRLPARPCRRQRAATAGGCGSPWQHRTQRQRLPQPPTARSDSV